MTRQVRDQVKLEKGTSELFHFHYIHGYSGWMKPTGKAVHAAPDRLKQIIIVILDCRWGRKEGRREENETGSSWYLIYYNKNSTEILMMMMVMVAMKVYVVVVSLQDEMRYIIVIFGNCCSAQSVGFSDGFFSSTLPFLRFCLIFFSSTLTSTITQNITLHLLHLYGDSLHPFK